jgi:SAM-dependent methyltransferase
MEKPMATGRGTAPSGEVAPSEPRDFYERTTCRLCGGSKLQTVVELTPTPPGNHFLRPEELGTPEPRFPLELRFCADCCHLQLGHVVDPRILFQRNYSYVSGTSPVFVEHFRAYAAEMVSGYGISAGDLVIDIGSNDGTCLRFFQEAGCRVLGVDPAEGIARLANDRGIETIPDFFSEALAAEIAPRVGPAKLITSHNALAHIDDLHDIVRGVERLLAPDGLFVFEVGYFLDVFQNVYFDTIYHEHLDYHTVTPLASFLGQFGLELRAVKRISPQGGSIRVIAGRAGGAGEDESVARIRTLEKEVGLDDPATLREFGAHIDRVRDHLGKIVRDLKEQGKTIAGFGAPTKATTLLTHFRLGDGILDFIVDENPLKQGMLSPGHHIPVTAADEIYDRKPDYLLILAWNFAEDVMRRHHRYADEGGHFILPMPTPKVVQ